MAAAGYGVIAQVAVRWIFSRRILSVPMPMIMIHQCRSLDIMSLLSAWYKVITLHINMGFKLAL